MPAEKLPHILVVDDHPEIRELLGRYLSMQGFVVSMADGGRTMRQALRKEEIDLVVLDIMMPGDDGLTLCRELRQTSDVPIILLTARVGDGDRIAGLDLGADDYVTKPFNPGELVARVKAVLRRVNGSLRLSAEHAPSRFAFEDHVLDVPRRSLTSPAGETIEIGTAEFNLLAVFLQRPGVVMSRDQLLDLSAGRAAQVFDRSIDNVVTRLRRHLKDDPRKPRMIKTVWGRGYMFAVEVEVLT